MQSKIGRMQAAQPGNVVVFCLFATDVTSWKHAFMPLASAVTP